MNILNIMKFEYSLINEIKMNHFHKSVSPLYFEYKLGFPIDKREILEIFCHG